MAVVVAQQLPVLGSNGFPLQDGVVYGPIHSRRLGFSLGINPLPVSYKFCDFDCVYCQYGWTPRPTNDVPRTEERLKPAHELLEEIETAFKKFSSDQAQIDVITLAGNGEPTLHPEFLKLVEGLRALRDQYYPKTRIGILSDASQSHRPDIRKALQLLDDRYMKLDAGDIKTIEEINRPAGGFNFDRMVQTLADLKDIVVQSIFMQGSYDNTRPEQIEAWIKKVAVIKPQAVQVYTVDRPPADSGIKAVPVEVLERIAQRCHEATGILTEVYD